MGTIRRAAESQVQVVAPSGVGRYADWSRQDAPSLAQPTTGWVAGLPKHRAPKIGHRFTWEDFR